MAARALITGASGLIGFHVTSQWNLPDVELIPIDHETNDLLTPGVPTALVRDLGPTVVIHLAWSASGTAEYRTSVDNARWLAASLELHQACYGTSAWFLGTGTSLDGNVDAPDAYSSMKSRLRQQLHRSIAELEMTWLRPYYVFDTSWRRPALVAHALEARDAGVPVELRDPESAHDFIAAVDVGRAIVEVVRSGLRGEVAIGAGRSRRVRDVVEALGTPWVAAEDAPLGSDAAHHHEVADVSRLTSAGWSPESTSRFFHDEN